MKKIEIIQRIKETKIIPVIRTDSADKARIIIEALVKGGIDVLEVTMTIPGAVDLIAELTNQYKETAIIGAGTVLDKETAQKCIEAGAEFIVSPILN
nr:bifunctional 2-keto-4-hydroxyglutarate aldolase/2-keto-3-deoxy-6-phosphogluconate aldolase [Acidobacteriota bacterium]